MKPELTEKEKKYWFSLGYKSELETMEFRRGIEKAKIDFMKLSDALRCADQSDSQSKQPEPQS